MSILVVLLSLAAGAYALAVIERWAVHGHLSLTGPAWAALALLGRESLLARKSDRLFFELGPVLLLVAGLMAVAVIPLAPGLIITICIPIMYLTMVRPTELVDRSRPIAGRLLSSGMDPGKT